jgi:hypothetical protein
LPLALCGIASTALATYGCTFDTAGTSGCDGFLPSDSVGYIRGLQACAIAQEGHVSSATTQFTGLTGPTCSLTCGSPSVCSLPDSFLRAYVAGQRSSPEGGGAAHDASTLADAGDAESPESGSDAGSAGDASGCPGVDPMAPFLLTCTTTCGR